MKTTKERKSWFSMARVPSSWWRYSLPPTHPPSHDASPEPRAQSETLATPPVDAPRKSPCRDIVEEPEYTNTTSIDVVDEGVGTPVDEYIEPVNVEPDESVPNISFSFFADNDRLLTSTRIATSKNSLERVGKQSGCVSTLPCADSATNCHDNTRMDYVESADKIINLEIRNEVCDGSSSDTKDHQSSSSSDYQSIDINDEGVYQNDVKPIFESEYSIYIGKSVEIRDESVVVVNNSNHLSPHGDDVLMKGNPESAGTESPYASPRNSAISTSAQDITTNTRDAKNGGKLREDNDLYNQIRPQLIALSNKQLNESTQSSNETLLNPNDKTKSTKSLTELPSHPPDTVRSVSQNAIYKITLRTEPSPPRLRGGSSIKLSEKFEDSPKSVKKLPSSPSSPKLHQDRPPEPPPLPPVDWNESVQESSGIYELDKEEAPTPIVSSPTSLPDDDVNYEDVEEFEYCQQRAKSRRGTLTKTGKQRPNIVRVRSRLGKVVRAVSGWWSEERVRLNEVIQKHAHAQAVGAEKPMAALEAPADETDGEVKGEDVVDGSGVEVEGSEVSSSVGAMSGSEKAGPGVRKRKMSRPVSRAGLRRSRYFPEGQNGFEELRRFIKQGGDFCKDLSAILQERSEAESQYAKSLSKLSSKLSKASKDCVGTVNVAWQEAGLQMEAQSEIHRVFAQALSEEVVKPLRQMIETQHRTRKGVESAVDKSGKSLSEWRAAEAKSKKQSFVSARENEKMQDAMLDVRLGRAGSTHALHHSQKIVSDKESAKLEAKRRKAEDAVKKADVEYYTFCIRAERARLEWETAVIRGSHCFQALEEERLQNLKDLASCYLMHTQEMGPKMVEITDRLSEPVNTCDVSRDIQTVVSIKGTGQPIPEQLLPDFYAEHITLAMNRDRRRIALVKLLQLVRQDLDRERRGKQGVENLAKALQETPNFGAEDSQQNVTEKLHHMRSMLTYLEAARYKVQSALAELDGRARGPHPLAGHIQVTRDRQGLQQSVLKVPPWVRKESTDRMAGDSPDWTDRGAADGNSVQPDSDFDEFSSQGSEKDYQSSILTYPVISECSESTTSCGTSGQCKALYDYSANLYDELNLRPGDVINIHDKQPDGWWLGELNGVVGIFPATYVEEMK